MDSIIDRDLVRKLIRKRQKTGKDIGRLLMFFLMGDIERASGTEKSPPMTSEEFYSAEVDFYAHLNSDDVEAWKQDKEKTAYNALSRLYESASTTYNYAIDRYWQFSAGFLRLYSELEKIAESEKAQRLSDRKPAIMTAAQYEAAKKKAAETLREGRESYYSLLFRLLDGLLYKAETMKLPNPLLDALEAAKNEPVKGKQSLTAYNARRGYFAVEYGGGRSDQMTREEWQQAVINTWEFCGGAVNTTLEMPLNEKWQMTRKWRIREAYRLFFRQEEAGEILYNAGTYLMFNSREEIEAALFKGFIDLDFPRGERLGYPPGILEGLTRALSYCSAPLRWQGYGSAAAGATTADLLDFIAKAAFSEEVLSFKDGQEKHFAAFKKDFPQLYNALHSYITARIPQAEQHSEGETIFEEFIDRAGLEARGIAIREPINREIIEAATGKPATSEEIAILQSAEREDHVEQDAADWLQSLKGKEDDLRDNAPAYIYPALGYIYAYNELVKIIEQVYDLPNFAAIARRGTATLEEKIQNYNSLLHITYHDVVGSDEEKEQKREFIKRAFPELDAKAAMPSEGAIKMTAAQIKKIGLTKQADRAYRYLDDFILAMYESTKAGGKEE